MSVLFLAIAASSGLATAAAPAQGGPDIEGLRRRFANPPKSAGTTTLWWLNGRLTKTRIREQMLNLRDQEFRLPA
ncbi:MAG: hypothetical protein ACC628_17295 [Pirellulaceae bacterium]